MLSGTEVDIINTVARLREATREQIRREVGFSLDYIYLVCRYLVRKGYLVFCNGRYSLTKAGAETLPRTTGLPREEPEIDKRLIKEIAGEVYKEISGELEKAVKGIKIPVAQIKQKAEKGAEEQIKIRTDFEFPVEDESLALESNIDKIGVKVEKEKSNIDRSIQYLKQIIKRIKKR